MFKLSQFDLKFAFVRLRTLCEYIQNQARSIQDPAFQRAFQVTFLNELVIEHLLQQRRTGCGQEEVEVEQPREQEPLGTSLVALCEEGDRGVPLPRPGDEPLVCSSKSAPIRLSESRMPTK